MYFKHFRDLLQPNLAKTSVQLYTDFQVVELKLLKIKPYFLKQNLR